MPEIDTAQISPNEKTQKKYSMITGWLALLFLFGLLLFLTVKSPFPTHTNITPSRSLATVMESGQSNILAIAPNDITAQAAYVYDISNDRVLYQKNANAQLPLASLTKAALGILVDQRPLPDEVVNISASALEPEGDSGFTVNEQWRAHELLSYTLMTSSNDGAAALAEHLARVTDTPIQELLDKLVRSLDLRQTFFANETGLDIGTSFSGGYGSAQDMGKLFSYIYKHHAGAFADTALPHATYTNMAGVSFAATNTNPLTASLPGIVLGKTGFTDLAGGNLVMVVETEPAHAYVLVVLGSTYSERFADMETLYRALVASVTESSLVY